MKNYKVKIHIGNSGSTLITVIVAIAFVTILTSIILGSSVMNIRMKSMDRTAKDDFYYAEKALNDIYTGIGQEAAKIAADEYEDAFKNVGLTVAGVEYSANDAEKQYKKMFIEKTAKALKIDPAPSPNMTVVNTLLKGYVVAPGGVTVDVKSFKYEKYDGTEAISKATAERIRLKGVQVTSKDDREFQATVSTDIIIEAPTMDFLESNVDVTDYCIIANKGLYINGDASISGNVYAGIHAPDYALPMSMNDSDYKAEKLFGGINIKGCNVSIDGNYIVSKGDINLSGENSKLTVGSPADANHPNVYYDTLRTCADSYAGDVDEIDLNANCYALNDLEINDDHTKAIIKGNYYGYNDKTLPDPTKKEASSFSITPGHEDADSSAIIINGSSATLDMSGIRTLVLMGRAYVDFDKGGEGGIDVDDSSVAVAPTAEAVALKTNQQLYLVPTDLLESPNPVLESDFDISTGFVLATIKKDDGTEKTKFEDWFGNDFVNQSKPFKTYKVKLKDDSGEYVVYYAYLNFNPSSGTDGQLWVKDDTQPLGYRDVSSDGSYKPLGTHGSVSSMEAFFDIIMNSKERRDQIMAQAKDDALAEGNTLSDAEAESVYESQMGSPSPYTIYNRIIRSTGYDYFDLQDCVIGNEAGNAILYSQNAVVNYETEKEEDGTIKKDADGNTVFKSKMLKNNAGMERYASYPQSLFHRYQWLATYLNAHQDLPLSEDPNNPSTPTYDDYKAKYSPYVSKVKTEWNGDGSESAGYKGYTEAAEAAPIGHFVALDKITAGTDTTGNVDDAVARGLTRKGYGDCIVRKGTLIIGDDEDAGEVITVGNTFKGVAIVDGDIIVKPGMSVNGLLMATGVVVIEGGSDVNISNDKGLIQARIEKEIANVKTFPDSEPESSTDSNGLKNYYLINYLTKDSRPIGTNDATRTDSTAYMLYNVVEGSKKKIDRIQADYHSFMFYENWQKGPIS